MQTYKLRLPENYTPPPLPGRDKWLAALRSGQYKQGLRRLCADGKYCCLGVLSEIQGRLNNGRDSELQSDRVLGDDNPLNDLLDNVGVLPVGVLVQMKAGVECLAGLNDNGLTFPQIADIIEKVWSEG